VTNRRRWILGSLFVLLALAVYLGGWELWGQYHWRAAERALAARDFAAAREHLVACRRAWPTDRETLLLSAQAARRGGDVPEAEKLLRAGREAGIMPEALDTERKLLGIQCGNMEEAEVCLSYSRTATRAADTELVLEAVIVGGIRSMDLPHAQAALDLWQQRRPAGADQVQGKIWAGDIAIRKGDIGGAIVAYQEAVEAAPTHDAPRQRLAEILSRYDPPAALPHLQQLLQNRPNDPTLRLHLARCQRGLGEHEQARQLLDALLAENPQSVDVLLERGQLDLDMGNPAAAEPRLRRAVALETNRRDPNLALARCLRLAGKEEEAKEFQERVTKIDAILNPLTEAPRQ
jgi:tetratricopeptide (TPR) repeat protein